MSEEMCIVIIHENVVHMAKLLDSWRRIAEEIQNSLSKVVEAFEDFGNQFEQAIQAIYEAVGEEDKEAGKKEKAKRVDLGFPRAAQAVLRLDLLPWYTSGFL